MIILKANPELKLTFERLIEMMKVPVKWNGLFAVVDNYMILPGEVRSLFFNFDTGGVTTNIIDIPVKEEDIKETAGNVRVQNAVNMVLYAFGKWGDIKGLKVDKSYEQLSRLFSGIMREIQVEPEYNTQYLRFYRAGMRVTYEDVIQMAVEYQEEEIFEEDKGSAGLWRKIAWERIHTGFAHVETTLWERRKERLGKNFYVVGYLCPDCGKKLYMAVYPEGKEFRIETEEGGVLLARSFTCDICRSFYTPVPEKLIGDGDVYTMQFADDEAAYEDYLELLGRTATREPNHHCNRFADSQKRIETEEDETLDELCASLPELSDSELKKLSARMEEGFYSDESTGRYEEKVREQRAQLEAGKGSDRKNERIEVGNGRIEAGRAGNETGAAVKRVVDESGNVRSHRTEEAEQGRMGGAGQKAAFREVERAESGSAGGMSHTDDIIISREECDEVLEKYKKRMSRIDGYNEKQLRELARQLEREPKLSPERKREYLSGVNEKRRKIRAAELERKVDACEGKRYIVMKRVLEEVENAELSEDQKEPMRERLLAWKNRQAVSEVEQLIEKMPENLDRKQYVQYMNRIRDYEDVDLSQYEDRLHDRRERAEQQEIANIVRRARKISREDIGELLEKLREGDFLPELTLPYEKKLEEKIRKLDEEQIALICLDPMQMTFEEGIEAYRRLTEGDFLPELKEDAIKMLSKRLAKIKTDECELLVQKLRTELAEAGIGENERHHFYPAKRALMRQALPEETEVIDFALATYASGRGLFEYPILVVDATKSGTGKEGIILTPDHLYYSTMLNAYGMEIDSIERIGCSMGLLNRGLYVYQKNGTKTKIPYAVGTKELPAFAKELDDFIHYLQEKPDSRTLLYLASEKHETICCFRCGHAYKGGTVCPKCGYQNNE